MSHQSLMVNLLRCKSRELRSAHHILGFIILDFLGPGDRGGSLNCPSCCHHSPNIALLDPLPHVRFRSIAVTTISLWNAVTVYHLLSSFLPPLTEGRRRHFSFG